MPTVSFTPALARFVAAPSIAVEGETVASALAAVFDRHPALRGYVLDDQGAVRRHVAVFINGRMLRDRAALDERLNPADEVFVFQALSGG